MSLCPCPTRSTVSLGGIPFGGPHFPIIAGPCAVESAHQMEEAAAFLRAAGAACLRGGAFKPRTDPRAFQGLGLPGLELVVAAGRRHGLPVLTELMDVRRLEAFLEAGVDAIQVGSRNMQNFDLLRELGRVDVPVVLKRGLAATLKEWVLAADHIRTGGNERVLLCERGVRSFEPAYRNMLDVSAIAVARRDAGLPVIIDPSHACGHAWMVPHLAAAALAVGADGLLVEVHPHPEEALCDGDQSLSPEAFETMMAGLRPLARALGREV